MEGDESREYLYIVLVRTSKLVKNCLRFNDGYHDVTGVKRKAPAAAADAPRKEARPLVISDGGNEHFNEHFLRYYYARLFPYKLMFRWLAYGNDPDSLSDAPSLKRDFFHRREFNFTLENDVFVRYLCFRDADELAKAIQIKQPHKIDIGPVYTALPSAHNAVKNFAPVERELVFDIDMDAYDEIRTCCKGAKLCGRCWSFINVAVKVLDTALREDFGFQHILFVYSGRRGMHCWVCDEAARKMDNSARASLAEYLSALTSGAAGGGDGGGGEDGGHRGGPSIQRTSNGLTVPMHPALVRAYAVLEPIFESSIITEAGQGLLAREESWARILDAIPADLTVEGSNLRELLRDSWGKRDATPALRWRQFKQTINGAITRAGGVADSFLGRLGPRGGAGAAAAGGAGAAGIAKAGASMARGTRLLLEKLIPAVVITYTYPRLDIEVSKTMNHLLKAPFCVHPKTGRICVPIDPADVDAFDPLRVPTVAQLSEEATLHMRSSAAAAGSASGSAAGGAGAGAGAGMAEDGDDGTASAAVATAGASTATLREVLWRHTSLKPYLELFTKFVQGCERDVARQRVEASARVGGIMGDI